METFGAAIFGAMLVPLLLIGSVPLFIYVYVVLRWRAGSGEEPGLGSFSLVLMFRLLAVLTGVGAVSLLVYAALSSGEDEQMTRICWPLLVASLIFLVIQYVMGSALDAEGRFKAARRIFGGGLVAISGLVTFGALAGLLITFWEKVPDFDRAQENHVDRIKAFGSWFVCFGAVYFAAATRMARGAAAVRPA